MGVTPDRIPGNPLFCRGRVDHRRARHAIAPRSCDQPDLAAAREPSQLSKWSDGKIITESNRVLAHLCKISAVLDGIPVRWVTVLRGSELGVLRGRQSRHIRHRSDMTKLAGVDHSADRLTTPSATSSSTTLTTRPLASYNTALGWPSTQASRIQAPRTRPRRSRPTSSRMTRYRRASGFPIACALPPPYEHRPLHRREGLQQHKERHGQRVDQLGARPARAAGGHDDRLGKPVPHVRLPPHSRRTQVVDAQPRHHGRQVRLRIGDRGSRLACPRNASCTMSSSSPTEPVIP